jgi:hypothetical protein
MPKMDVRISCGIGGAEEIHIERVVGLSQKSWCISYLQLRQAGAEADYIDEKQKH